ncbi:MAG TPA: class I SAM-dependent methyltransferase [Actinomycetota bacterium]|nr:class I SAM-dependent methyltransferase [Actinomycetota bacterium]
MGATGRVDRAYALGSSEAEHERLTRQAALLEGITERLFREAGIGAGMRVLDVGCGAGDVAFLVAELVGRDGSVVGIDVDAAVLEVARGRAELLGLRNVTFVHGDLHAPPVDGVFDAVVGRLVLMHVPDPAAALRAVAAHVRPGGVLAFLELDQDPGTRSWSFPEGTSWDEVGRLVIETFARAGAHVRMGRQLWGAFRAAGLPAPAMREEALVGGGPGFPGYGWLVGVARSLSPLMRRLGVADPDQLGLETLAARIRDDVVARDAVVWTPPFVGAHARRSEG